MKNQFNESAFKEAIPLYERAIQLDPNFTDAYISFGQYWSYGGLVWGIFNEREAWDKAKLLFERALELDPTNYTVALELHIGYFYYDWNFADFEFFIKEVNETETFDKSEYQIFSDFSMKIGKFDEVILFCDSEIKKFPLNSLGYIHLSWSLFLSGNKDRSNEVIDSSQSMFTDDLHYLMESSRLYYYLGDYKNSKKLLDILMNNFKDRPPLIIWLNAVFANVEKNSESAQNNLDKLHQHYNDKVSGSPAWFIALYYCHIKDYEKAFEWLQKSYDRHEVEMTWLKEEPLLRPLRSDPRYIELYDKVGFSKIAPITPYVN